MSPVTLTPLHEHYLKKELITRQLRKEVGTLALQESLKNLGPPFNSNELAKTHTPFLRFVFRNFVQTFPFLEKNGDDFWLTFGQFVDEFHKKNISSSVTRNEATKRKRVANKMVSILTLLLNAGTKTTLGRDESIRVEDIFKGNESDVTHESDGFINNWNLNVAAVRSKVHKTHLLERVRYEYIIITKRPDSEEVAVARGHKEFRALHGSLKEEIPEIAVPRPPSKIKDKTPSHKLHPGAKALFFKWEKNRNNLRAYMRQLLAIKEVARSTALSDFLTRGPIRLTDEELLQMKERKRLDDLRDEQRKRFAKEAEKHAKDLKLQIEAFKKELLTHGGLSKFADMIKTTSETSQLPAMYQKIIEYGEINFASILYSLFMGSDNSAEIFAQLKRVHRIMPYRAVRGILKISNPFALMRGLLDLFLAQPFGRKSLMQRLLSASLSEDIKEIQKDIDTEQLKIADPEICVKLKNFVYASAQTQQLVKEKAVGEDNVSLLRAILRSSELEPELNFEQLSRFNMASESQMRLHAKSKHISSHIITLHHLLLLYVRQRDKELLIDLLIKGVTADLLRDLLAIFYEPLARVYRAAHIGNSITDVSAFIEDLIEVVDKGDMEGIAMYSSPENIVQTFVSLVQRHTQNFYCFVHAVYSHDSSGVFSSLLNWMEGIVEFLRKGLHARVDLGTLVATELEEEDQSRLLEELDSLISWHTHCKQRRLSKLRNIVNGDPTPGVSLIDDSINDDAVKNMITDGRNDLALSDSEDEDSDETESWSFFDAPRESKKGKRPPPDLVVLPKLLKPFVSIVDSAMVQMVK